MEFWRHRIWSTRPQIQDIINVKNAILIQFYQKYAQNKALTAEQKI